MVTTTFTANNITALNTAIKDIDAHGADAAPNTVYTIDITGPINISGGGLEAINLLSGSSVTIEGTNAAGTSAALETISGQGTHRGFFVYNGRVTLENLTLTAMKAGQAGNGGDGADGGGGGAGLGGGLFVASGATVFLGGVQFSNDSATGGNGGFATGANNGHGGGGGMAGATGGSGGTRNAGGGGGIGFNASGGNGVSTTPENPGGVGIVQGADGGGAGGFPNAAPQSGGAGGVSGGGGGSSFTGGAGGGGIGGAPGSTAGAGGNGGFGGGGGGGGLFSGPGGDGGFGGGGGGSGVNGGGGGGGFGGGGGGGGDGGFGAGDGSGLVGGEANGGGGLGAGGDIFVQQGGTLIIEGGSLQATTLGAATVKGGTGGSGGSTANGGNGQGLGGALFVQGDNTIDFAPPFGQTVTVASSIADQAGFGGRASVTIAAAFEVGTILLTAANTYTGGTTIETGTLELGNGGSILGNVTFEDTRPGETLRLDSGANQLGVGNDLTDVDRIAGFTAGDSIDLAFLGFNAAISAIWLETGPNAGTLSLLENGTIVAALNLSGQYTSAEFSLSNDGHGGTAIGLTNPPPPAGTTGIMILSDLSDNLEIYDLGGNAVLASAALGNVLSFSALNQVQIFQVVGLGGFFGSDTSDIMLRNELTGAFQIDDVSNNNITNSVGIGQVGLEWAVAGFGDFSSRPGETDMLLRNSNTGAFEIFDISNNAITSAASMGQVGLEWQVAGFGDFSGNANEADMLMRNTNTGAFEIYDISNNQLTNAASMGAVGLEWSVAGFGAFSGNANETDMLMRDSNTGAFEIFDISHNQLASAAPLGQVGLEWQVVGFGPINGAVASDMLMRDSTTGALEVFDIASNKLAGAAAMGQVGLEWTVAGIAADPPGGAPSSQLVQAMASYASPGGALDSSVPLGAATTQQSVAALLAAQAPHANSA